MAATDTNTAGPEKAATTDQIHIEHGPSHVAALQDASLDDKALNVGALVGTEAEHSYGFTQGFKTYRRAALWSIGEFDSPRVEPVLEKGRSWSL